MTQLQNFSCKAVINGDETDFSLESLKGKKVVLYFYPKDNTPGCTLEALAFNDLKEEFDKLGTVIVGISSDSMKSHQKFSEKKGLGFAIVSDESKEIHDLFGTWKLKKMMGKEYMGTERATFILDEDRNVIHEFRNVKAAGHAEAVLEYIKSIV